MLKTAAIFDGPDKPFILKKYEEPAAASGQVVLDLIASGVCGTDVHICGGFLAMPDFPLIIGHEFIGSVASIGDGVHCDALGRALSVGDKCIACVAIPCGKCYNCRRGETASCMAFQVTYAHNAAEEPHFHGGFAECLCSLAANVVKLPDGVDPFAAAAVPCGGPTVIRACEYGGGLNAGEVVVVQGNGPLGLFALAWAKAHDCRVIVVGSASNPERVNLMNSLKPDAFFNYRDTDAAAVLKCVSRHTDGNGADVVIETSGAPDAFPFGIELLRTRGRYFVPGQYSNRGNVSIAPQMITFKALRITGSGQYTLCDVDTYIEFLKRHAEIQPIFAAMLGKYPVSAADNAIADAKAGKAIKAVLVK